MPEFASFDILDDNRLAGLLSRERRRLRLDRIGTKHWLPIHEFLENAEAVENELIDPKKLLKTPFGDCYSDYLEMLERYHFLTYGQLITRAVEALEKPAVFKRVHGNLRHLIVDEYQDINPAQERLISLLAREPVQLCVVGDDDQAIYQWRGSQMSNILKFKERYGAARKPLTSNRRSRPKIVRAANAFARSLQPRLPKEMKWITSGWGPEIVCWTAETPEDEAKTIADAITKLHKAGFDYSEMAILLRSVRTSSAPILAALTDCNVPVNCTGRTGLFLQPEAQALGRLYAWLSSNDWKDGRYQEPEHVDLKAVIAALESAFGGVATSKLVRRHLRKWKDAAEDDNEPANLVRDYYEFLRMLDAHRWDLSDGDYANRLGRLARFSELLADFEHVRRRSRWVRDGDEDQYRGGQSRGPWFYRSLYNYIQHYALEAYEDFGGEENFGTDEVVIATVHAAKGLEWPVVFVPCLVARRFPSSNAGSEREWLLPQKYFSKPVRRRYEGGEDDERRLFYVAMTRAKDVVYFSAFERLLKRRLRSVPLTPPPASRPAQLEEKPEFSFSDLADYENCPLSYRLRTLFGFQPQLAKELGYGRAVHHVLRRIADFVRHKGKLPAERELGRIFKEEFYLPFADKPAYEELHKAARKLVDRYLNKYSTDFERVWESERPFELHLDNAVVTGRADVILDREGGVVNSMAIVDYKTSHMAVQNDVFAFQLAIYAAAGRREGINVAATYIHDLSAGVRIPVNVDETRVAAAKAHAETLVLGLAARQFPPKPEKKKCTGCDVRFFCKHGRC